MTASAGGDLRGVVLDRVEPGDRDGRGLRPGRGRRGGVDLEPVLQALARGRGLLGGLARADELVLLGDVGDVGVGLAVVRLADEDGEALGHVGDAPPLSAEVWIQCICNLCLQSGRRWGFVVSWAIGIGVLAHKRKVAIRACLLNIISVLILRGIFKILLFLNISSTTVFGRLLDGLSVWRYSSQVCDEVYDEKKILKSKVCEKKNM